MGGEDPLTLNNKRLLLENKIDNLPGVQFSISTVSGHTQRTGQDTFWIGFFVAYVESEGTIGSFLNNFMDDVGLYILPPMKQRPTIAEKLAFIMKDHNNACVKVILLLLCSTFSLPRKVASTPTFDYSYRNL